MTGVTINVVSYRYGHLAAHAVESALSQTVHADQVVLWDDGAEDCAHIARLYPDVKVIERPCNLGIVANLNDILWKTTTEKVLMLDADNFLRPDALEKMIACDSDIASSDMAFFGQKEKEYALRVGAGSARWNGYLLHEFHGGDINRANYIHGNSLYDVAKAKAAGGYHPSGHPTHSEEDWVLFRSMLNTGASHSHVPEPLLFYRRHRLNFQS